MYFNKIHHPMNFSFGRQVDGKGNLKAGNKTCAVKIDDLGDEVFRLSVRHRQWGRNRSQAELEKQLGGEASRSSLEMDAKGVFRFRGPDGKTLLQTDPKAGFGVSGRAWLLKFNYSDTMRFYGMGEKSLGFELSHQRTKFWNTDLFADFHFQRIAWEQADPQYLSIPYLVIKQGRRFMGMLINNPYPVFMATNPNLRIADQSDADEKPDDEFYAGAPDGCPEVYMIAGPTLADVTCRLQRLVGTTPRPPLWALGHHQCRWGYRSIADLNALADQYEQHKIPCSALWLDIDYMDGFRVFTFNDAHFENPNEQFKALLERGYRVVPIIDPGVKIDPKYEVYKDGLHERVFCENPEGTPYVGFVWPGATAFPDFSMKDARAWWARHVAQFVQDGIQGVWIDMNDPSTGASENSEMLFDHGKESHDSFHNQYAFGMAKATKAGLLAANPEVRPFVLSRSGYTSMARHSAVWTGDNCSNEHHMRQSIPMTLNLSISGLPFNGPDVPGFGCDADAGLAELWYQCGFLFPFLRNHSATGTREQEPWAFGAKTMRVIRDYIRTRYKLLPYIYNLFIEQEREGHPVMRPMLYEFTGTRELSLEYAGHQYMLGPWLLHAPFLDQSDNPREVELPGGWWYDLRAGEWLEGNRKVYAPRAGGGTPLYVRDGAIIPMARQVPDNALPDLADIELHAFFAPGSRRKTQIRYEWDDGLSFAYKKGDISCMVVTGRAGKNGLVFSLEQTADGAGSGNFCVALHGPEQQNVTVKRGGAVVETSAKSAVVRLAGCECGVMLY
jgi:alpha-glucosidase